MNEPLHFVWSVLESYERNLGYWDLHTNLQIRIELDPITSDALYASFARRRPRMRLSSATILFVKYLIPDCTISPLLLSPDSVHYIESKQSPIKYFLCALARPGINLIIRANADEWERLFSNYWRLFWFELIYRRGKFRKAMNRVDISDSWENWNTSEDQVGLKLIQSRATQFAMRKFCNLR